MKYNFVLLYFKASYEKYIVEHAVLLSYKWRRLLCLATALQVLVTGIRSERDSGTHNHPQQSKRLRSSEKQGNIKEINSTTQNEKNKHLVGRM
jgi:hypothetical protein